MFKHDQFEKSFNTANKIFDNYWQMFKVSMENMAFNQEKTKDFFNKYMEQSKKVADEQKEVFNVMANQAKKNQEQMKNIMKETIRIGQENLQESLTKKPFNMFNYTKQNSNEDDSK
ncbi:hypothetical protein SYNTR_0045 [Candidatus Syntrophocurvum alkaliphilum]|uniref:Phasin domain-containing protein n=1 Tax=Candidatus Syntrophocurvum alkaliphilum TaxID=2293317 RepID=A0A6I6DDE7_9FIRM|nr:hypothetical protein [Candidatus Syntrophocurvum alkaliphilum]QGT98638.1 hypothetical protein SYNTR_0045 [Candidatus Syntrophocurvum alkaliphilum]